MQPLRVEFDLISPMTEPSYPVHLDGLLAWAAVSEAVDLGIEEPLTAQEKLPLDRRDGVWCASALSFEWIAPAFTVAMTKRTDVCQISQALDDGILVRAPNKLRTNCGPWRQAQFFDQCRYARSAIAYCIGDLKRVHSLLQRLGYLGARRRNGRGRIAGIRVDLDDTATMHWKRRIMPVEIDGYIPVQAVSSPPYWDRSRSQKSWMHPAIA